MPANYNTTHDVRNCYGMSNRPKRYVWGVYLRTAPTVILSFHKRKRDAAHMAAIMSGPLIRDPPTPP